MFYFLNQKCAYTTKLRKPEENDDKTGIFCKQRSELVPFTTVDGNLSVMIQEDLPLRPICYYAWHDHNYFLYIYI